MKRMFHELENSIITLTDTIEDFTSVCITEKSLRLIKSESCPPICTATHITAYGMAESRPACINKTSMLVVYTTERSLYVLLIILSYTYIRSRNSSGGKVDDSESGGLQFNLRTNHMKKMFLWVGQDTLP